MIYLSAGHYPKKKGASFNGVHEHDLACEWVELIYNYLPINTAIVVPPTVLKAKVAVINKNNPWCAVEIHFNSAIDGEGNRVGKGGEVLYYPGSVKGLELAECVERYLKELCLPWRGCKEGYYRMRKEFGPDFFLAKTKCPSIIIEPEFIHNLKNITDIKYNACLAIAEALTDYVFLNKKE